MAPETLQYHQLLEKCIGFVEAPDRWPGAQREQQFLLLFFDARGDEVCLRLSDTAVTTLREQLAHDPAAGKD